MGLRATYSCTLSADDNIHIFWFLRILMNLPSLFLNDQKNMLKMNYSQVQNTTEDQTNSNFNSDKKKGIGEY